MSISAPATLRQPLQDLKQTPRLVTADVKQSSKKSSLPFLQRQPQSTPIRNKASRKCRTSIAVRHDKENEQESAGGPGEELLEAREEEEEDRAVDLFVSAVLEKCMQSIQAEQCWPSVSGLPGSEEDALLGADSCDVSLCNSSKTEDELLASDTSLCLENSTAGVQGAACCEPQEVSVSTGNVDVHVDEVGSVVSAKTLAQEIEQAEGNVVTSAQISSQHHSPSGTNGDSRTSTGLIHTSGFPSQSDSGCGNSTLSCTDSGQELECVKLEEEGVKVLQGERAQLLEDKGAIPQDEEGPQVLEEEGAQVLEKEEDGAQILEKEESKVLEEDSAQLLEKEESQVLEEDSAQVLEKEESQVLEEDGAQVLEREESQVLEEDNAQLLEKEESQVLEEDGAQILEKEESQVLKEDGAQVLEKEESQVLEEEGAKKLEEEGDRILEEEGAQKPEGEGALVLEEGLVEILEEEGAQIATANTDRNDDPSCAVDQDDVGVVSVEGEAGSNTVSTEAATQQVCDFVRLSQIDLSSQPAAVVQTETVLADRVQHATSSLNSFVFPADKPVPDIEWVQTDRTVKMLEESGCSPVSRAKLPSKRTFDVQDVACSPMPASRSQSTAVKQYDDSACSPMPTKKIALGKNYNDSACSPMPTKKSALSKKYNDFPCSPMLATKSVPVKKECIDMACSPIPATNSAIVKECSDAACSPIPGTKGQSAPVRMYRNSACSPMPVKKSAVARECSDMACSPMPAKKSAVARQCSDSECLPTSQPRRRRLVSLGSSPLLHHKSRIPVHRDVHSVSCSPMTPTAVRDCSVLTCTLELVATGVMVCPEVSVQTTMTDSKFDYYRQFLASQKLVSELQAALAEYSTVEEDIEMSRSLQDKMATALTATMSKMKMAEEKLMKSRAWVTQQRCEIGAERDELTEDWKKLETERGAIQHELEDLQAALATSQHNSSQMETLYQSTATDLLAATSQVCSLQTELALSRTDLQKKEESQEELGCRYEELQVKTRMVELEVERLTANIAAKKDELCSTSNKLSELQKKSDRESSSFKETIEKKNVEITNLQRTLDMREEDIDQQESQLFEFRENFYLTKEKITNLEYREKNLNKELDALREENSGLKDCIAILRAKEQELRGQFVNCQEELASTKSYASQLLTSQAGEINQCSSALSCLKEDMNAAITYLKQRAGIYSQSVSPQLQALADRQTEASGNVESCSATALDRAVEQEQPSNPPPSQNSFVAMILQAAVKQATDTDTDKSAIDTTDTADAGRVQASSQEDSSGSRVTDGGNTIEESPGSVSRRKLGFSGNSAFAAIKSVGRPSEVAQNCQTDTGTVLEAATCDSGNSSGSRGDMSLPDSVLSMRQLFAEITRVTHILEKAYRSSLHDIKSENEELSSRLLQCETASKQLQTEVETKGEALAETQQMVSELNARQLEMDSAAKYYAEREILAKQVQLEVEELRTRQQSLESENALLAQQQSYLVQQLESVSHGNGQGDLDNQKEILTLQKKVTQLRGQLREKDDFIEEVSTKATKRIKKIESNWKKAESEVYRFDNLLEMIRNTLLKTGPMLQTNTDLKKIMKLIDGREPL